MLFPTVLCLLIAAGIMLAGPGIVRLMEANRSIETYLQKAKDNEKLIQQKDAKGRPIALPPLVKPETVANQPQN